MGKYFWSDSENCLCVADFSHRKPENVIPMGNVAGQTVKCRSSSKKSSHRNLKSDVSVGKTSSFIKRMSALGYGAPLVHRRERSERGG